MQILTIIFLLVHFTPLVWMLLVRKRTMCPNESYCECNWEAKKIECMCKSDECKVSPSEVAMHLNEYNYNEFRREESFTFENRSLVDFKEIYINNIIKYESSFFRNAQFAPQFRLSIQSIRELKRNLLANMTGLNYLEIIYFDLAQVDVGAFEHLKCETFSFIALGKNYNLNLNQFGPGTEINSLILDFHSTHAMSTIFVNTEPEWTFVESQLAKMKPGRLGDVPLSKQQLLKYWSSKARVKKVYIQEVKGLEVLDYRWVPRFVQLDRIELFYTDVIKISPSFALLHSDSLKYLTIRQSKIEIIESRIFEHLTALEYLDLSSNPIKMFELEAFYGLASLKTLTLQSIMDTYIMDESDLCTLSYLPCNVDVYLDNYDDATFGISCALIFLHELRNDTNKFQLTINSNLFKMLPKSSINYQRDVRCKLKDQLRACLEKTNRADHCLVDKLGVRLSTGGLVTTNEPPPKQHPAFNTLNPVVHSRAIRLNLVELTIANLTNELEYLKRKNEILSDIEAELLHLNETTHEIRSNISKLFDLYQAVEYISQLLEAAIATTTSTTTTTTATTPNLITSALRWLELTNESTTLKEIREQTMVVKNLIKTAEANQTSQTQNLTGKYFQLNQSLFVVIMILFLFLAIQIVIGLLVFYLFCKLKAHRRLSSSKIFVQERKLAPNDAANELTSENLKQPEIFQLDSNGEFIKQPIVNTATAALTGKSKIFTRADQYRKPKFVPRQPVEFLRDSSLSLKNFHL